MAAAFGFHLFGCDGCFVGLPAVISLAIAVLCLIGSIYMLLWSNFGARLAYLILMVSLFSWLILLSAIWLFGAPGTTPGTGPRGAEAQWVPFTPTSAQAGDFKDAVASFPNGWDTLTPAGHLYPGKIDAKGELENVRSAIKDAESRLATKQKTQATSADDWSFRPSQIPAATPDELDATLFPPSTVAYKQVGQSLLFGAEIGATAKHPQTLVFAVRDKGKVFLYALYFLVISILGFALHLWMLARLEMRQKAREAELKREPEPVAV